MEIGIKIRTYNKTLSEAIRTAGFTNKYLAKKLGTQEGIISMIRNIRIVPDEEQKCRLAVLLNVQVDDIFPPKYELLYEKLRSRQEDFTAKFEDLRLEENPELLQLPDPDINLEAEADGKVTQEKMMSFVKKTLKSREADIIKRRFGFEEYPYPQDFVSISRDLGLTRERIHQIYNLALEKLRGSGCEFFFKFHKEGI